MQSFKNALLFEPLSFCSFGKPLISLPSAPPVGLDLRFVPLGAILTWYPTSFAPWLVVPPPLRRLRKYLLMQKGVACRFLPEEISNFATTVALPQIELSSSMQSACLLYPRKQTCAVQ